MSETLSATAQKVQQYLDDHGFQCQVVELPASTRTAREAAQAIGCTVGQIVKSLIFQTCETHKPILVVASGPNRVNEARLGELVGEPIAKASPDFVREQTGFVIGGVAPIAHIKPLATFIDEDLFRYQEIWAAAGTPFAVFQLTPQDLTSMTAGKVVSIK